MKAPFFINDIVPERFIEVDAARLLLILNRFALNVDDKVRQLQCFPSRPVIRYLTPEYYLHKLDFLLRYPSYFAFELIDLHRMKVSVAAERDDVINIIRMLLEDREPDLRTDHYRKFWRGAYERLDAVEAWWHSRKLVYTKFERRGGIGSEARPTKFYFLTEEGQEASNRLIEKVEHARWYDKRIHLIHHYFSAFSPAELKGLQYSHEPYRQAQIDEEIPDLSFDDISSSFMQVFGEALGVEFE